MLFISRSEKLFEFNAHDKEQRVWIDKEIIASMVVADNHLENSIVHVWYIMVNRNKSSRQKGSPNRSYFTIYVYVSHVS